MLEADPAAVVSDRDTVRLAFVAAIQYLPARQRAVLILRDVLRWKAAEVAEAMETTTASVNSALQRAHATLQKADLSADDMTAQEPTPEQKAMLDRYVQAFWDKDIAAIVSMLTKDAIWEMPPYTGWYQGNENIGRLIDTQCPGGRNEMRMLPTRANGQPAFGLYMRHDGGDYLPFHLQVLTLGSDGVERVAAFFDGSLFRTFGLPDRLPADGAPDGAADGAGPAGRSRPRRPDPAMSTPREWASPLLDGPDLLERAVGYARTSLLLVADATAPTPCTGWDLLTLLHHMNDSLAAFTDAADIGYVDLVPVRGEGDAIAVQVLVDRLKSRACALLEAWTHHPGPAEVRVGDRRVRSDHLAAAGSLEVAVHGWDVARACGVDRPLPPGLSLELLDVVPLLVGADDRPGRFAPPIDVRCTPGRAPGCSQPWVAGRRLRR